ncbi:hypothetical protein HNY42_15980 (plasmid) [Exiguobacterium sp. Helios]|uniref:hypothetical protein n=1 Tax=Exiguobacterium sp. Helios TaxID=2735868 RepID=UPI00165D98BB|nr:hypothetical protein [Exiguobacterium sp. Helios]QNR22497.1 hypothetical protein HNY42_15980 [Exiguobacterium sp. Helios]
MSTVIPPDLVPGKIYPAGTGSPSHFANEPLSRLFRFGKGIRGLGNQGGIRRSMIKGRSPSSSTPASRPSGKMNTIP